MSVDPGTDTQRGPPAGEGRFEPRDTPAGRVGLWLVALIGALLLLCGAVAGLFALLDRHAPSQAAADPARPPEPRLQVDEPAQRRAIEARADAALAPAPGRIGIAAAMRRQAAIGWEDGR